MNFEIYDSKHQLESLIEEVKEQLKLSSKPEAASPDQLLKYWDAIENDEKGLDQLSDFLILARTLRDSGPELDALDFMTRALRAVQHKLRPSPQITTPKKEGDYTVISDRFILFTSKGLSAQQLNVTAVTQFVHDNLQSREFKSWLTNDKNKPILAIGNGAVASASFQFLKETYTEREVLGWTYDEKIGIGDSGTAIGSPGFLSFRTFQPLQDINPWIKTSGTPSNPLNLKESNFDEIWRDELEFGPQFFSEINSLAHSRKFRIILSVIR